MSELKPCPFCGAEAIAFPCAGMFYVKCVPCQVEILRSTRDEAVRDWNRRAQPVACEIAEYAEDCKDCGFCAQPANEPLTLEQLREMEQHGEGIYVTHADGSPIFRGKQYTAAVLDRIAAFGAMGYHLQAIYGRGLTLAEDDCGKTWLAYRHKPGGEHNA